mmetsp:Transcript_11705/g.27521  ORF Transcript_11705/g.27521 Transcript_11705/m.27521 type:complete len:289 (+) Transcript_11705:397-1263(+)
MMPLVTVSTACRSLSLSPLRPFFMVLAVSAARTFSILACSREMVGTYLRLSCHASNFCSSTRSSISAWMTLCFLRAWFLATTSFRSSTLYALTLPTSLHWLSTLRGTEMSMSTSGCGCFPAASGSPHTLSASSGCVMMQPVAEVEVKAMSLCCIVSHSSSMSPTRMSTSGYSAAISSARGRERLSSVSLVTPCEARCVMSSLDILPAPMMVTRASESGLSRSASDLSTASSTAAEEMETAPCAMPVSERTNLPDMTAVLSSRPSTFWAEPGISSPPSSPCPPGEMACE